MIGAALKFLGIGSGISVWAYVILFAAGVAVGGGAVEWVQSTRIDGYQRQVAASDLAFNDMTTQRNVQAAGLGQCNAEKTRQQAQMDADDQKARQSSEQQEMDAQQLAALNDSLKADNDKLFQSYEEAINARQTQINVQQVYPTGWDPIVAAAARHLRSVQLAAAAGNGADPADDRVPGAHDSRGSAAAGTAPGAALAAIADAGGPEARPSAQQQIDLIGNVSQLYQWGASCYADKRAIAASQQPTAK